MTTALYEEDGWRADVEVLENTSDSEWSRYKLRVIHTHRVPNFYVTPADNSVFSVTQKKGVAFSGMWHLTSLPKGTTGETR